MEPGPLVRSARAVRAAETLGIGAVPGTAPRGTVPYRGRHPRGRRRPVGGTATDAIVSRPVDFHEFYREARPAVGRALAVTLGDPDLAADAVDEAMIRAYQRWSQVARLDNPGGWVYRVGLNWSRRIFRMRYNKARQSISYAFRKSFRNISSNSISQLSYCSLSFRRHFF